ncbi:MAG: sigma factor-like helix-turn-helix DNA-binding protein, partial [Planctomycetota bacterium]
MRRATPDPPSSDDDLEWARALALRLAGSSHAGDVDDLVQETYLRAIRNPAPAHLRPRRWLGGIMRKVWLQLRRHELHRLDRECAYAAERESEHAGPGDEVLGELVVHVDAIAPEFGRVLRLRYVDGFTVHELAEREGLTVSAAKARLRRAHERLRERLDGRPASLCAVWLAGRRGSSPDLTSGAARRIRPRALGGLKAAGLIGAASLAAWAVSTRADGASRLPMGPRVVRAAEVSAADPRSEALAPGGGARVAHDTTRPDSAAAGAEPPVRAHAPSAAEGRVVVAIGPDGAPASDVPVALIALRPRSIYAWRGNTGPKGVAAVVPRDVLADALAESEASGLFAGVDAPQENASLVRVDASRVDAARLELPLPTRSETIRIRPETRYGAAPERGTDVKVLVRPEGERRPCFVFRAWVPPGESIDVPYAACDVALSVQGRSAPRWARTSMRIEGPRPSGGTTEVRLVLDNERVQLRFRAEGLDAEGLEAIAVLTPPERVDGERTRYRFKSDGSGTFQASLPRDRIDAAVALSLELAFSGASLVQRPVPLPVQPELGVLNLGELAVAALAPSREAPEARDRVGADASDPLDVVARGRVLVPPGVDLAAVLVELRPSGSTDAERVSTTWTGPDGTYRLRGRVPGRYDIA